MKFVKLPFFSISCLYVHEMQYLQLSMYWQTLFSILVRVLGQVLHCLSYFQLPPNDGNYLNALWGKLASEILMQNWETALEDLNRLKEVIEANVRIMSLTP